MGASLLVATSGEESTDISQLTCRALHILQVTFESAVDTLYLFDIGLNKVKRAYGETNDDDPVQGVDDAPKQNGAVHLAKQVIVFFNESARLDQKLSLFGSHGELRVIVLVKSLEKVYHGYAPGQN